MKTVLTIIVAILAATCQADIVIYANPNNIGGGFGPNCPGFYASQAQYIKQAPAWGWKPSTNTSVHCAVDTNNIGARILYGGRFGDNNCGTNSICTVTNPPSPTYRFILYFTNSVGTNPYPLVLKGFDP